jgi:hypothetical protein
VRNSRRFTYSQIWKDFVNSYEIWKEIDITIYDNYHKEQPLYLIIFKGYEIIINHLDIEFFDKDSLDRLNKEFNIREILE